MKFHKILQSAQRAGRHQEVVKLLADFFFSNSKMIITRKRDERDGEGNQCINYTSAGGQKLIFIVIQMMATLAL